MRKTKFITDNFYHVLNRGNQKNNIFLERENYLFFLRRLKAALEKYGPKLVCYCLMPNHYHLLLEEAAEPAISNVLMAVQISYAKAINKRYQRVGHLFQGPFKNIRIDGDEYLLHLSRYIHLNPVWADLVEKPEDWEFSSYRDYVGLRNGKLPYPEIVLSQFPDRKAYREFVMEYKDDSNIRGYTLE